VAHEVVKALYDHEVGTANAGLANFETIKKFVILAEEWTIPDGALTPTLKVKRRIIEERHADLIDALYAE
jgi:long-chain acyl-CoA synthetase